VYVIGLTGNIATGKTTVAAMLANIGAQVIDADRVAHDMVRPGTTAHQRILQRFGSRILREDGQIDRGALGAIVFADARALVDLERMVHPEVIREVRHRQRMSAANVAVVEAIKLLEAKINEECDSVWVVTSPRRLQLKRLVQTRDMTPCQAALRIDAQPPPESKTGRADVVIDNSVALRVTWLQVLRAWNAIPGGQRMSCGMPCPCLQKGC